MRKGKIYPLNKEFQRIPRRDKKVKKITGVTGKFGNQVPKRQGKG